MSSNVLLVHAGGGLGVPLVKEVIRQRARFQRVAILSDPAKVEKFDWAKKQGIEIVVGSFLVADSYKGFDTVLSLAGNSIMRLQPAMIDLAISAGVQHFYPSEWGAEISQAGLAKNRYFRDKIATRDHLRAAAKAHPGFRYTLIVVAHFAEWIPHPIFGFDEKTRTFESYGSPDATLELTAVPDIARYTVDSLFLPHSSESPKREIRVRGDRLTWNELIQIISDAQGIEYRQNWIDPSEAHKKAEEARVQEDEETELLWSIKAVAASGFAVASASPAQLSNELFSFKAESARQIYKRMYSKE